ncbi:hypothetical protein [Acidovorax radicis]|jgi:uncharacterized membrane protein YphA (DoxX/SURF4 family)|uniref:hypothetical protein n=1 Tax=Acidovorax radicis TaxID=758826 RepID=UPI001CF923CE|nr:hypothetical protein [Acidovorax radicis]UCU98042.1 hypothetical protein KI609_16080 [Acidovorax radicis]
MKPAPKFVAAYVLLSAVLGGLALLQSFPARPTSWVGWLLLFALAVPVTIAAEFVGELIFRNPVSQAVERRTKEKSFSWLRILAGLVLMLVVFAAVFCLGQLLA